MTIAVCISVFNHGSCTTSGRDKAGFVKLISCRMFGKLVGSSFQCSSVCTKIFNLPDLSVTILSHMVPISIHFLDLSDSKTTAASGFYGFRTRGPALTEPTKWLGLVGALSNSWILQAPKKLGKTGNLTSNLSSSGRE
jgi:hypothetical protein